MISSQELRCKYIKFFKSRGHVEIPSASLIPDNDPSVLFTTAGMSPLVPFLLGEKHPAGKRLVNCQKCVRTGDIDDVGDKTHHTFFEMLGHWSLSDYWKEEALKMTFDFVTQELGLDKKFLAVSVFEGDKNAKRDDESIEIWKKFGISEKRIKTLPKDSNWWEPTGNNGPCGPCTEMFYWTGDKNSVPDIFDPDDSHWVEIGNDVLMEYEKVGENKYQPAQQKNIDNGTGLDRLLAVMNDLDDNYQTDLFKPIIEKIEELSGKKYGADVEQTRSMRIIADHLRAATFIMGDDFGVMPSNVDQGYVARKLIRRAIRHGKLIGINQIFCFKIAEVIIKLMQDIYPELRKNKDFIVNQMVEEEKKFIKTLEQGLEKFNKLESVNGQEAFNLYQTYGFPFEMTKELAKEKGIQIDEDAFNEEMTKHQDLSRTAAAGKFKGGLADHSEKATQYHTATHLLLAALRQILGDHIFQKGSNITDERMRFDFSHADKLTAEQLAEVEKLVNNWIQADLPVVCCEMSLAEAKDKNIMGVFANKYGEQVKVYSIGVPSTNLGSPCSREICGGPHVASTGVLGKFKILKEESSSAGVRRIKAVLE